MNNTLPCCLAAACAPLLGHFSAHASLVGDWTADTYTTGASTWPDSSGNGHTATAVFRQTGVRWGSKTDDG